MNSLKQKIVNKSGSRFASVTPNINIATALEKIPTNVAQVIKSRTGYGYTMTIFVGPSQKRHVAVNDLSSNVNDLFPEYNLDGGDPGDGGDGGGDEDRDVDVDVDGGDDGYYYKNYNYPQEGQTNGNNTNNTNNTNNKNNNTVIQNNSAIIRLPYSNMMVSIIPQNTLTALDKQRYKDIKFHTQISGHDLKTLTVTRTDVHAHRGWDFDLQLKAYYAKDSIGSHHKEFDFLFKNEESAVTLRLKPKQKLRCLPNALIFKEEQIQMVNPAVDVIAKRTPVGRIQGTMKGMTTRMSMAMSPTSTSHKFNISKSMAEYHHVGKVTGQPHVDMAIVTFGIGGNIFGRPTTPEAHSQLNLAPSKIIHLPLGEFGNKIIFKKGACLATSSDVQIVDSGQLLDSSFQSLVGYGDAFLITGQAMKKIILRDDQDSVAITDSCLIAFTQDVISRVEVRDKFMGMILDKTQQVRTLTGPGIVWLNYFKNHVLGDVRMSMSWDSSHGSTGSTGHDNGSTSHAGSSSGRPGSRSGAGSRRGLARHGSSRTGKSNKDISDDVSITSMDPSIRELVDWENDDNFSVDESAVVGLEPVLEQGDDDDADDADDKDADADHTNDARLEAVQEDDYDQAGTMQKEEAVHPGDHGDHSDHSDYGDGNLEEVKLKDVPQEIGDHGDHGDHSDYGDGILEEVKLKDVPEADSITSAATEKRKNT